MFDSQKIIICIVGLLGLLAIGTHGQFDDDYYSDYLEIGSSENTTLENVGRKGMMSREDVKRRPGVRPKVRTDEFSSGTTLQKLLHRYDNSASPPGGAATVKLGIYVNNFYLISENTMDYSMSIYFRQSWQDNRLKFESKDGKDKIVVPDSYLGSLWKPDTFFRNEKLAAYHSITVPNRLMRINSTGHVWYVLKISLTASCPMDLQKYPFDTQSCPLNFESFAHTMDTIIYDWLDSPVDVNPSIRLPSFTLKDRILHNCSATYAAGSFPCLEINFVLKRDIAFYILQIYLPTIMITCISWVSFWFPVEKAGPRTAIGLTTLLTSVLLSAWSRFMLPKVSYMTAMDIWNTVSFLFITLAFLQFVLIQFLANGQSEEGEESGGVKKQLAKVKSHGDKICRIAFPLAYLFFFIVYFSIYLS